MEARLAELEGHQGAPVAAKERAVPAPSTAMYPKSSKPAVSSAGADKYYTEGMRLYHAKKYADARHQMYQYLKTQPRGPKAPEARYYLADSFYQEGKYREAGVEFTSCGSSSPRASWPPPAFGARPCAIKTSSK